MTRKIIRAILFGLLIFVAGAALLVGGFFLWRDHRPQPPSERLELGDFFWPWWYHSIFDYYPHDNDPTDVNGFAASRGAVYSEERSDDPRPTLYLAQDNRAGIDQPIGAVYNAISGIPLIVENGHISSQIRPDEYYAGVHLFIRCIEIRGVTDGRNRQCPAFPTHLPHHRAGNGSAQRVRPGPPRSRLP